MHRGRAELAGRAGLGACSRGTSGWGVHSLSFASTAAQRHRTQIPLGGRRPRAAFSPGWGVARPGGMLKLPSLKMEAFLLQRTRVNSQVLFGFEIDKPAKSPRVT